MPWCKAGIYKATVAGRRLERTFLATVFFVATVFFMAGAFLAAGFLATVFLACTRRCIGSRRKVRT